MSIQFKLGFIDAMHKLSNVEPEIARTLVVADSPVEYSAGWFAAIDHFEGRVTKELDTAHQLDLVSAYAGYYGQGGFEHPVLGEVVFEATHERAHLC